MMNLTLAAPISRTISSLVGVFLWLGFAAAIAMMLHVTVDILLRVLFNAPLYGTIEIVSYVYMVAVTFLPLGYVQATRGLITIEVFTQSMAQERRQYLDIGAEVLTAVYLLILATMAAVAAYDKTLTGEAQDATAFQLSVWPMRWILAASCAVAVFAACYQIVDDIRHAVTGRRFPYTLATNHDKNLL
jgi:TRAP-type C4-dicarboxylate transport system permease small subunit